MKSVGIRYFEMRSMPFTTPSAITPHVIERKTKCQARFTGPFVTRASKLAARILGSLVTSRPITLSTRYFMHQPPTTL